MDICEENYRFYIYVECRRGKTPTDIYNQLHEASMENIPSMTTIWRWHTAFKTERRHSLQDEHRIGRPICEATNENVRLVKRLISEMPKQSCRGLAADTGMTKDTVFRILTRELGMKKVCSVWIPHHLSDANRHERMQCATSFLHRMNTHSVDECMKLWVTEDETWALFETRGTKQDNKAWLPSSSTVRPRVLRTSLTNKKVLLLIAFTGDAKFSVRGMACGETITAEVYTDFVHETGEKWRVLRSSPTKLRDVWWQHDNARPHKAHHTTLFLERRNVAVIPQSPYSPDLNQCDRWINKALKSHLRNMKFDNCDNVVTETLHFLRGLSPDRFHQEFERLRTYCQQVIACRGDYVT